ncbi:MAG: cell envelope integrity protein TolA [Limisphaerales bacterium]
MSAIVMPESSLRLERAESRRLAWAFVLSLVFHLMAFSGYEAGRRLHVWQRVQWPAWMVAPRMLTELFVKPQTARERELLEKRRQEEQRREQMPLIFVDVSPAQATPEPPKKSDYYSDKNSLAANPDTSIQSSVPKIDGKQNLVPKTEDIPRTQAFPLRPAPAPAPSPPAAPAAPAQPKTEPAREVKPEPAREAKPKAAMAPGDLAMGRPEEAAAKPELKPDATEEVKPRAAVAQADESSPKGEAKADRPRKPRRLSEVPPEVRMAKLAGEKMKQDGGVRQHQLVSSLDVTASPFGSYDEAIISAVQERWYALLDERSYAGARTGKVMLRFHLNADGSVTQMKLVENTVDLTLALICQSAIRDPAPFAPWPSDMRKEIGANYREVTFAFYYR